VAGQRRSFPAAKAGIPELAGVKHVITKANARLNNRAENSHQHVEESDASLDGKQIAARSAARRHSFVTISQDSPAI